MSKKQVKKKTLEVACEHCNKKYEVIKRGSERLQKIILDFAVCTHCQTPRYPLRFKGYIKDDLCRKCNVPKKYLKYCGGARGLCGRCYVIERIAGTKRNYPCLLPSMAKIYD